mgnify:CR=1 FL=1
MQPVVLPFIVDDKASGPLAAIAASLENVAKATTSASIRLKNLSKTFTILNDAVKNAAQTLNSTQFKQGNLNAYLKVMQAATDQLKAQAQHQAQLNAAQLTGAKQQAMQTRANASAQATIHKAEQYAIARTAAMQQKSADDTAKKQAQIAEINKRSDDLSAQRQARTEQIQQRGGGGGGGGGGMLSATAYLGNIMKIASYGLSIVGKIANGLIGAAKFLISIPGRIYDLGKAAYDVIANAISRVAQLTGEIIKVSSEFEKFQYSFASMLMASGDFEGVKNESENIIAALEYSNKLYKEMVVLAAELPGEAQDFMDAFLLALPSGRRVGLTDPEEFMKLSSNVTAIGISLGHSALRAGNSLNQLLQGTTTKQNALTQKLLTSIGMATVQFNKLKPEERLAKIKDIIEAYGDGIEAYKNTFDALYTTMQTHLKETARIGTKPIFEHSKMALKEINLLLERFGPTVTDMLWELSMDVLDYVVAIQNYIRPMLDDVSYYIAVALEKSRGFFEAFIEGLLSVIPFIKQIGAALKEMAMKVMGYLGVKMPKVDIPKVVLGYPDQIEKFIGDQFKAHTPEAKGLRGASKESLKYGYQAAMAVEPLIPKQMEQFGKALGLSGEKIALFGKELKFEAERKEYEKRFLPVEYPIRTYKGVEFKSATIKTAEVSKPSKYSKYIDVIPKISEVFPGQKAPKIAEQGVVIVEAIRFLGKEIEYGAAQVVNGLTYAGTYIASELIALPATISSWVADLPSGKEVGLATTEQASKQVATSAVTSASSLMSLHDGVVGLIVGFGVLGGSLTQVWPALQYLGSVLSPLLTELPLIGGMFEALLATSLGPLMLAIGGFIRFMTQYTDQFAIFSSELTLAGAETITALISFGKIFGLMFDVVGAVFAGILPGIAALLSSIMSIVAVIFFIAEKVIMPIARPVMAIIKFLSSIVGAVFGVIAAALKYVATAILWVYNYFKDSAVVKGIAYALNWLYDAFTSAADAIDKWVGWLIGHANKALEDQKKQVGIIGDVGKEEAKPTLEAGAMAAAQETANKLFESIMIASLQQAEAEKTIGEVSESYGNIFLQGAMEMAQSLKNQETIASLQESALATVAESLKQTEGLAGDIPGIMDAIREKYKDATYTTFKPLDVHKPEAAKDVPKFAGKGLNNYQDFRGSRFSINQKFEEGFDPDRIAVAFTQDLSKIGEKRIQSGLSPLYTVR